MNKLPFTKMEGIGNDYVYVNGFTEQVADPSDVAKRISDRHFGVGSDGLVLILPSEKADVRMRMFNSDGSEAEMCGNASRCVGKYVYEHGIINKPVITLETKAGIRVIHLNIENNDVVSARVDMGEPELTPERIPVLVRDGGETERFIARAMTVAGQSWDVTCVSMGNPHAVMFVPSVGDLDLPAVGALFEKHPFFPQRINTEFVEIVNEKHVRMRVWERGAGETLACGTGACAVVVAGILNKFLERRVMVELLGGILDVEWNATDNHVYMTGPAKTVFEGVYQY